MTSVELDGREVREQLLDRIAAEERALGEAVHDLTHATHDRIRLGHWVSRTPYGVLLGAAAFGFWLGFRH
jgi:hypothetical protein